MERQIELLQQAVNEIRSLRSQNQLMAARLDTFDKCVLLLTARVQDRGEGMSPDLVWEIEKHIEASKSENKL